MGHADVVFGADSWYNRGLHAGLRPRRSSGRHSSDMSDEAPPLIPDYSGACVCNVVPSLLGGFTDPPSWFPSAAFSARQVVLLVLDGLGWEQMAERRSITPSLHALAGGPI